VPPAAPEKPAKPIKPPGKNTFNANFGVNMPLMSSAFDTAMWLTAAWYFFLRRTHKKPASAAGFFVCGAFPAFS
jgi:hypothetical protein